MNTNITDLPRFSHSIHIRYIRSVSAHTRIAITIIGAPWLREGDIARLLLEQADARETQHISSATAVAARRACPRVGGPRVGELISCVEHGKECIEEDCSNVLASRRILFCC